MGEVWLIGIALAVAIVAHSRNWWLTLRKRVIEPPPPEYVKRQAILRLGGVAVVVATVALIVLSVWIGWYGLTHIPRPWNVLSFAVVGLYYPVVAIIEWMIDRLPD
jgi:hypothetical protein